MPKSKILYSANTLAAYRIAKKYYDDKHYVWCSEAFGPPPVARMYNPNPPSSTPRWRYKNIRDEIRGIDLHGANVLSNKAGLLRGVEAKLRNGIISLVQRDEIRYFVDHAQLSDFKPLLYVMTYDDVKHLVRAVPVADKAHPLSDEYIIEELPGELFDVLDLDDL